jgi:hypothetical protein
VLLCASCDRSGRSAWPELAPGLTLDSTKQKYAQTVVSTRIVPGCVLFLGEEKRFHTACARSGPSSNVAFDPERTSGLSTCVRSRTEIRLCRWRNTLSASPALHKKSPGRCRGFNFGVWRRSVPGDDRATELVSNANRCRVGMKSCARQDLIHSGSKKQMAKRSEVRVAILTAQKPVAR